MTMFKIIQQGNDPVWEFKCPLCDQQWSEYWTEDSNVHVHEVDETRTKKLGEKTFQAGMTCRRCGLMVWSDKIVRKAGNRDE